MADHPHTDPEKPVLVQETYIYPQRTYDQDLAHHDPWVENLFADLGADTITTRGGPSRRNHVPSDTSSVSSADTEPEGPLEPARSGSVHSPAARIRTGATAQTNTSTWSRPPDFEVTFDNENPDPTNPREWPLWYRMWTLFVVSYSTWVIVLYSTSYTATIRGLEAEFHEPSDTITTLGVTTYLLGLAAGSLVCAPMSELFGRRPVYIVCLAISTVLILPCAMATSLTEIIVVRFFGALFGSVMVTNGAGTVTDIATEDNRALYMSLWSIAPLNGPVTGPLIGGFIYEYMGWRWDNWIVMVLTGAAAVLVVTVKETYAPVVLKQKAAKRRKDAKDERYWCVYEELQRPVWDMIKTNMSRPFTLSFREPILWFFNVWISVVYGILYLVSWSRPTLSFGTGGTILTGLTQCFVAYPIVFQEHRGWGPGVTGLSFAGIGIGTMLAIMLEPVWRRIINSHPHEAETGRVAPEASASIMSLGAVLAPIGQLVFAWTCLPVTIHWAVPIAFGIPFGVGNTLCFIYGTSYLAGAYGFYAASALAGNAVMRSVFGAMLPLAGPTMYAKLTPQWAGTLLGLLELVLVPIPIVFYKYGDRIRAKSPVIGEMRAEMAKQAKKRARQQQQRRRQPQEEEVVEVDKDVEKGR